MIDHYQIVKACRGLIVYVLLQFCCIGAFSQKHHIQFDHIGIAEGLSQSNVLCVLKDSRGFMWFGTRDGLNKYDGYTFKVYKNEALNASSISGNYINSIIETVNGDLWIATIGGGICRFDRNSDRFIRYQHDPKNANTICNDVVNSILEDHNGKIWVGTETGLDLLDPAANTVKHFTNDPNNSKSLGDNYIRYVFKDSHQNLWLCTRQNGLDLYDEKNNTFRHFPHVNNDPTSIGTNNVITIFEDHQHRLWVGTDGTGAELFDPLTGRFRHYKHDENKPNSIGANTVYAINEDAENNIWFGTENGGLSILDYETGSFTSYRNDEIDKTSISNNSIYAIYRDSKNNMWTGNFAGGIDLVNRDKIKFTHYKHMMDANSLSNNHVLSIFEDTKKNIWIGTDGGGLNLFDPRHNRFTHFRHEKNNQQSICGNYVLTACEDDKGNIWVGTWGDGITRFNPTSKKFVHYKHDPSNPASLASNNDWMIMQDSKKNIWVGTFGGGLNLYDPRKNSFTHFRYNEKDHTSISSDNIIYVFEDSDGVLWIGTDGGGLNRFNSKDGTFTRYQHQPGKNSISNNSISSIYEDKHKNLWVGSRVGLNLLNKRTGQFTVYTVANGLPDNAIFGILADDKSNLWLSTNKGICCFNTLTGRTKNYGVSDGLQSDEFKDQAFCKSSSGLFYFGGNNGFNQFYPDSIRPISFEPPLVVTSFQVSNKEVAIALDKNDPSPLKQSITETNSITLPASVTVFSFQFATLNYTSAEKKKYAYMLEGFDDNWNDVGTSRIATYTHLSPGKYVFKVRGLNNEGNWSPNMVRILLIIEPPFWLTWWFTLLIFLAIAGSIYGFYTFRMNIVKAQKTKLQLLVREKTKQLVKSAETEQRARKEAESARQETELANMELKTKNKELEQFAYVASHDLQEPLRTTSGFIELIQQQYRGKLDAKADKYLDYISDASERMKVLIKDLLDFSRIGSNGELESVDCNEVVSNVMADLQAAIIEASATIHCEEMPVIIADRTEIQVLFQNLLINAIKFRRKDVAPVINIAVKRDEGFWEFAISDNGIGIQQQHRERIFDIFQRLHTRKEYAGSGIGLSHCKKIVELHHGRIRVESEQGEGSTFYFTIPIINLQ